jgi:hypothetical protein
MTVMWTVIIPVLAVTEGTEVLVGNYYGERSYANLKKVVLTSLFLVSVAMAVIARALIGYDLTNKSELEKFMKTAFSDILNSPCLNLAEKWAPEAIQSAEEGLSHKQTDVPQQPISCASEVVKKMGASDEEMVMVAGFAGGLGLSGNACGALSAAIWMNTLGWCRKHPGESPPYFNNPNTAKTLEAFYRATHSEILCHKITGQCFKTIGDHTEFIKHGGCHKLINVLGRA